MITVGSLFSGIGGMDLGLERAGMKVVWQSEIDPYACKVLKKHWPDVPNLGDITKITEAPCVDLICGGFPCQDLSCAGKQSGITGSRSGLFFELMRVVRLVGPRLILLENVPGLLVRPDWMGSVLGELAESGYNAEWDCIPAAAVGASHLRYRVFIVGHATNKRCEIGENTQRKRTKDKPIKRFGVWGEPGGSGNKVADTAGPRTRPHHRGIREGAGGTGGGEGTDSQDVPNPLRPECEPGAGGRGVWEGDSQLADTAGGLFAGFYGGRKQTQRPERRSWWATEPNVGRVAHGVPNRVDRLKCLGNAVVPQVAEWIGRRILKAPELAEVG